MIRGGKLDRTITIERNYGNPDADGVQADTWQSLKLCRAQLVEAKREHNTQGAGAATDFELLFRMRWTHLQLDDRIVFHGRIYQVSEIREIGQRQGIELRVRSKGVVRR